MKKPTYPGKNPSLEEWDDFITRFDDYHEYQMTLDPSHPKSCCSEDCYVCDSVGIMNFDWSKVKIRRTSKPGDEKRQLRHKPW